MITNRGGEMLENLPIHPHADSDGASSRAGSPRSCYEMASTAFGAERDSDEWIFSRIIVISHPNGCRWIFNLHLVSFSCITNWTNHAFLYRRESYLLASAFGIPIIHPKWIVSCIAAGASVSLKPYMLPTSFTPLRPYFCFPRNRSEGGILQGIRVLDLVSSVGYTVKDAGDLSRIDNHAFSQLISSIKVDKIQAIDIVWHRLYWRYAL